MRIVIEGVIELNSQKIFSYVHFVETQNEPKSLFKGSSVEAVGDIHTSFVRNIISFSLISEESQTNRFQGDNLQIPILIK